MTEAETALHALIKARGKANKGEWLYRPDRYDDWGFIRCEKFITAISRNGDDPEDFDANRANKTDPYEPNGRFIAAAANWVSDHACPLLAEREKDRAREKCYKDALQWIIDLEGSGDGTLAWAKAKAHQALTDTRALPTTEAQNG